MTNYDLFSGAKTGHWMTICPICDRVIEQCGCPSVTKTIYKKICQSCFNEQENGVKKFINDIAPKTVEKGVTIIATYKDTGDYQEITDLYWFEENGVHDLLGNGHSDYYWFDFYLNGNLMFSTKEWEQ